MATHDFRLRQKESTRYATLRDWCAIGFRRKKLVTVSFLGLLLGTFVFSMLWAARYYESSMQILVLQDRSDPAVTSAPIAAIQNNQQVGPNEINSEMALMQGSDLLRQVVVKCGLAKRSGFGDIFLPSDPAKREAIKVEKQAKKLAKKIKVEAEKQADVIDVTYGRVGSPETPACVLDSLGKLYLAKHLQAHRPSGSFEVFAQEAEKYHKALSEVELKLANFGRTEGIVAPDVTRPLVATKLIDAQGQLNQSRAIAAADQRRITNLEEQLKATPSRSVTVETNQDAGILTQQLQAQLLAAELKRTQFATKYDPSYPLMKEAEQEVAQAKSAIEEAQKNRLQSQTTDQDPTYVQLRGDLAKTRADLATQQATIAALGHIIRGLEEQSVSLNQMSVKQQDLIREAKADESNYLLYLAKREQERSSDAMDRGRLSNVALAVAPVVPVLTAYNPWMICALGILFSIFASMAIAFVAEYLDPAFRTPSEVAEVLEIPVLAAVPKQAA